MTESEPNRTASSAGPTLATIMVAILVIQATGWASGLRGKTLAEAVERGAARVEAQSVGEVAEADIRRAIDNQRSSLRFWAVLSAVGDFVVEPLAPALRAVLAASGFAAIAALSGRPVRYAEAMAEAAAAQWFWVIGLGVQVTLMIVMDRTEVETSLVLWLPPGSYPAVSWIAARQFDLFALLGWIAVGRSGWRLGLVGPVTAGGVCLLLWGIEASLRIGMATLCGAAIRATLMPR
ncbi:hypothetical protein [Tautonia marina]|uniref:hypothetical protein n=1 Tax=Tautonia marina TaxID=2653855 RepID=UPI001260C246|nr:hypothetical protein [Tautonia marina]